jgi:anti-anti-sigma regulatory factor
MSCIELREALTVEVAKKPRLIVVDMSALTFIDSVPGR